MGSKRNQIPGSSSPFSMLCTGVLYDLKVRSPTRPVGPLVPPPTDYNSHPPCFITVQNSRPGTLQLIYPLTPSCPYPAGGACSPWGLPACL